MEQIKKQNARHKLNLTYKEQESFRCDSLFVSPADEDLEVILRLAEEKKSS